MEQNKAPLKCPSCGTELEKANIKGRRNIWHCSKENTNYRLKVKQKPRNNFDINDESTWHATCVECGNKKMEYHNFKYHCNKCGHTLYV